MDSYHFLYSIPIFPMSRCVELCFEYGFRNPDYEYWYAHPVASQNLSELYGSDSRRKTALLRPELCSTSPSYIKYNLYLSSNKIRKYPCFLRCWDILRLSIWIVPEKNRSEFRDYHVCRTISSLGRIDLINSKN
jgi:hypothetical protein